MNKRVQEIQQQVDAHKKQQERLRQEEVRKEQQKRDDIQRQVQFLKQQKARRSP